MRYATARSCANIAFIKYWGNLNQPLRIAASPSLSMNLADLYTTATVDFEADVETDVLKINDQVITGAAAQRVFDLIDLVRTRADIRRPAYVETQSNFPAGAGIASSAAAFSALALAASAAAGLSLSEAECSALARRGSGSASRSVPPGYCQWLAGGTDETSFATSIASPEHWDLYDVVAVVSTAHKQVGSTGGHAVADSSTLQAARLASAEKRFDACKAALLSRDLEALGLIIEADAVIMHSVMMTSEPPLFYWLPGTLEIIHAVREWRTNGVPVYYTIDAGPNVHLICERAYADQVVSLATELPSVDRVYGSGPGGPAQLLESQPATN